MNLGRDVGTLLGGMGILIALYLIGTNWLGFGYLTTAFGGLVTSVVSTLQGRGGGGGGGVSIPGLPGGGF